MCEAATDALLIAAEAEASREDNALDSLERADDAAADAELSRLDITLLSDAATEPVMLIDPGIVVTYVLPAESVAVVTRGAPGMPVAAAPRRSLIADSNELIFGWYSVGIAVNQLGVTVAVRAELTIDCGSPVTLACEAALAMADWTEAGM